MKNNKYKYYKTIQVLTPFGWEWVADFECNSKYKPLTTTIEDINEMFNKMNNRGLETKLKIFNVKIKIL